MASDLDSYKHYRRQAKIQIHDAYERYLCDIENSIISDSSNFWHFINNRKSRSRIPATMFLDTQRLEDPQVIVDAFGTHFSSVGIIPATMFLDTQRLEDPQAIVDAFGTHFSSVFQPSATFNSNSAASSHIP
ncbi:hypothetical protein QE152_g34074 [Popillia japonica]|uniref:Uncharacterized protein n=1 Tax=Popillia japonica TaxID=7064 RepID=A0AAW1IUT4_POPJA